MGQYAFYNNHNNINNNNDAIVSVLKPKLENVYFPSTRQQ